MENKNKKTLFITDLEAGLEPFLHQKTNIQPENMLIVQSYGSVISHPYGDIMRSIILAIYQEKVEEIYVVGVKGKKNSSDAIHNLLTSDNKNINDKLKTLDYLFKNCKPEFYGTSVSDWLDVEEDVNESIKKSAEMICNHPLVPSYVKVQTLLVNKIEEELATINQ